MVRLHWHGRPTGKKAPTRSTPGREANKVTRSRNGASQPTRPASNSSGLYSWVWSVLNRFKTRGAPCFPENSPTRSFRTDSVQRSVFAADAAGARAMNPLRRRSCILLLRSQRRCRRSASLTSRLKASARARESSRGIGRPARAAASTLTAAGRPAPRRSCRPACPLGFQPAGLRSAAVAWREQSSRGGSRRDPARLPMARRRF